jgi:hypothetical protein
MRSHGIIDFEVFSNTLFFFLSPCACVKPWELFPKSGIIDVSTDMKEVAQISILLDNDQCMQLDYTNHRIPPMITFDSSSTDLVPFGVLALV